MGVIDQRIYILLVVIVIMVVWVCAYHLYFKYVLRKRRWSKVQKMYLEVLLSKTSDDGKLSILGCLVHTRVAYWLEYGKDSYVELGGKLFQQKLIHKVHSITEDIREENDTDIERRVYREYNQYLQRKEEQNDTDQSRD